MVELGRVCLEYMLVNCRSLGPSQHLSSGLVGEGVVGISGGVRVRWFGVGSGEWMVVLTLAPCCVLSATPIGWSYARVGVLLQPSAMAVQWLL